MARDALHDSFEALGVHDGLMPGLRAMGLDRPTLIQSRAFGPLSSSSDCVLLDETGSGKTLAYLLPVLSAQLRAREECAATGELSSQSMILAPNRDLVTQVHSVVRQLLDAGDTGLTSSALTEPDANGDSEVLVATPAVALRSWIGSRRGGLRGPSRVRWMVLDEADVLLAGSFKEAARARYPVEQLIQGVKQGQRGGELSRGQRGGEQPASSSEPSRRDAMTALRRAIKRGDGEERVVQLRRQADEAKAVQWKGQGKQFVLAGATFPNAGNRNIEGHITSLFPTATWVRTERAHRRLENLRQFFVKVDEEVRADALRAAVTEGPRGRTLVFANTLKSAEMAREELESVRECEVFHKEVPAEERADRLRRFRAGELPVLVCTGLASRGIDVEDVVHVVQYDMAANAVEHMHRVGRTARAGKRGVATSLYTQATEDLVAGIRDAIDSGETIEKLFSRKRLFRKRITKARKSAEEVAAGEGAAEGSDSRGA